MTTMACLSPLEVQQKISQGAVLIDIRALDEYRREHIAGATQITVQQLLSLGLPSHIQSAETVIFHCKGGRRTQEALPVLAKITAGKTCFIMEEGIDGWKNAGLPTQIDRKQPLELMRQVQIAAGALVLVGVILGWLVSPWLYVLSGFVGLGLLMAGITGFCGMARLLAIMPWNRV